MICWFDLHFWATVVCRWTTENVLDFGKWPLLLHTKGSILRSFCSWSLRISTWYDVSLYDQTADLKAAQHALRGTIKSRLVSWRSGDVWLNLWTDFVVVSTTCFFLCSSFFQAINSISLAVIFLHTPVPAVSFSAGTLSSSHLPLRLNWIQVLQVFGPTGS